MGVESIYLIYRPYKYLTFQGKINLLIKKNKKFQLIYKFQNSWAAGSNPWGNQTDAQFHSSSHSDGFLEVVGLKSIVHAGCVQTSLTSAIRVAQGQNVCNIVF